MPLDFVNLEFFTYGFMGGIYTYTWAPAYAIVTVWLGTLVWLAIHREDAEPFRSDYHTWYLIPLTAGVLQGLFFAWSMRLGQLIDVQLENRRNNKRELTPEFFVLLIFTCIAVAGAYYTGGDFSNGIGAVPLSTAQTVGIAMLVVSVLGIVLTFAWQLVSKRDRFNKVMNFKYTISLSVGITVGPALYDYLLSISPWHGLAALGGILLYWLLTYPWILFFHARSKDGAPALSGKAFGGEAEPYYVTDRFYNQRQVQQFVVGAGLSQFIMYLVMWLVDVNTGDDPRPVAAASAVTAIVFILIYIALRFSRSWVKTPMAIRFHNQETEPLVIPEQGTAAEKEYKSVRMDARTGQPVVTLSVN